jgi:hypothetical protein
VCHLVRRVEMKVDFSHADSAGLRRKPCG